METGSVLRVQVQLSHMAYVFKPLRLLLLLLLLLLQVSMLVAGSAPGEEAAALQELRALLQDHQHTAPFESSPSGAGSTTTAAACSCRSVMEVAQDNIAALERTLEGWEARVRGRHTPSRVLKWASSTGRTPVAPR
jgi:hypothetical protein